MISFFQLISVENEYSIKINSAIKKILYNI
jgi:hypothetical protein